MPHDPSDKSASQHEATPTTPILDYAAPVPPLRDWRADVVNSFAKGAALGSALLMLGFMVADSRSDADSPFFSACGLSITCFIIAIILRSELAGMIALRFGRGGHPGKQPQTSILIAAGAVAGVLAIGLPVLANQLLAGTSIYSHIKSINVALFVTSTAGCAAGVAWGLLSR